jgi:hypothetical protein
MGTGLGGVGIGQWHWQCATLLMGCKGWGMVLVRGDGVRNRWGNADWNFFDPVEY